MSTIETGERRYRGLPPAWYSDADIWSLEVNRIWRREWHCITRSDQVLEPGDYLCVDLVR